VEYPHVLRASDGEERPKMAGEAGGEWLWAMNFTWRLSVAFGGLLAFGGGDSVGGEPVLGARQ